MYKGYQYSAILLMGGKGERFQSATPKQFHRLSGKKIYLHTLEAFLSFPFDEIILTCPKEWMDEVQNEIPEKVRLVCGGNTRQESSHLALNACSNLDFVVIHDAVRPFVSKKIIQDNMDAVIRYKAVDTCIPSADTIVHSPDGAFISSIPKRAEYLRGQTPQSFSFPLIQKAHEEGKALKDISDDCKLILAMDHPVHIVQGDENNIKITTELDLFLAEQLLRMKDQTPSPKNSLEGKVYAIVGGMGGIGSCIAKTLVAEGATALSLSRSSPYKLDLTKPEMIPQVFENIHKELGLIDGLINCAGLLKVKPLKKYSLSEIQELLAVNFTGLVACCQSVHLKRGGHIINLASSSFSFGRKYYSIYSSSKAAVVNFTQALSEELPDLKINTVIPARTNTPMRWNNFPGEDPNTLLDPEEVAQTIADLLKDPNTTGSIIPVRKV